MSMFMHRRGNVPELNMASMPDLIFTVLFFLMLVTHMRKDIVKVKYQVPAGTELTRLSKKSAVSYIYIGRVPGAYAPGAVRIQLNDKFADAADVEDYIEAERNSMAPEDLKAMTVSLKADRSTDMGTITDVKQALRRANALRVNYSAVSRGGGN